MKRLKYVYGFLNGMLPEGLFIVTAVTEDGDTITSVAVRSEEEGRRALGMDRKTANRHHLYADKYPEGVTLEWVPFKLTSFHLGLKNAIKAHYEKRGAST
jgi:hypothetical protein